MDGDCVPFFPNGGDEIYVRLQCDVIPDDANRTEAFLVSLVVNLIFALILYLIYALVRPHFKSLYYPRLGDSDVSFGHVCVCVCVCVCVTGRSLNACRGG